MATTKPITLTDLENQLHVILEGDTDYPVSGDDDWDTRLALINFVINMWESEPGIFWNGLYARNEAGGTIAVGDTTYNLSADVNLLGGFIELVLTTGDTVYVPVIKQEDAQNITAQDSKACYVTGAPGSFVLNLTWTPATGDAEIGATIKYTYYKFATRMASASDVCEISDPTYIVDAVVSEIKKQDNDPLYPLYEQRAQAKLSAMKARDEELPFNQDNSVQDDLVGFGL